MDQNRVSALKPVKKVSLFVFIAIALILTCFVMIYYYDQQRSIDDKMTINVLGRQRMDIQTICKDAATFQDLLLERDLGQRQDNLDQKISGIKNSINVSTRDYEAALAMVKQRQTGYEFFGMRIGSSAINMSVYLKQIENAWRDFDEAKQTVINSDSSANKLSDSIHSVDNYSIELLYLTDKFQQQLLGTSIRMDHITEYIEIGMIILLFMLITFYLYHLLRYIILPYNQLYKGIADIGLLSYPVKQSSPTRKKVMPLVKEVNDMFLKINSLISLIENINNNSSFMEILTYINGAFSLFIPYNYIGIALISEDKRMLRASYGVSDGTIVGLPEKVMGTIWPVNDTSLEPYLESGEARIINDLETYCKGQPLKPYNKTILEAGIRASIALPLKVSGKPVGMIFFSSKNKNVYNSGHLNILNTLANSIAISLNQNILASELQYSSILALANLSEARDEDTGEHMERMAKYSRTIAKLLYDNHIYTDEITLEYIDMIERFSPLHDIGKVGIMDEILLKPGKLTPEEFDEMKRHTMIGAQVLKSADRNMQRKGKSLYGMGVEIAEGHHEKWNGSGYPYGKKGTDIPLSARITAMADVFDALTSKRPYKDAFSFDESCDIIMQGRGTHFDPNIVDVFINNRKLIEKLYLKYKQK